MSTRDGAAVSGVVDELRRRIVTGELSPGEQIRQEDAATLLGVSRAPVREALRVLADQGLLEHHVHVGYFVRKRSASELRQIYMMLDFLERRIMETIEAPSDEVLERLSRLNDEMATCVDRDDWSPMIDLNRRFHFEIFGLSPLRVVIDEVERLWTIAAPYIARKYSTRDLRQQTIVEHAGLIDALGPLDRELADKLLDEHRAERSDRSGSWSMVEEHDGSG